MERHIKIQTAKSLSQAIDEIVKESLRGTLQRNAHNEQEKQSALTNEEDDSTEDNQVDASSKTQDAEKEKLKSGEIEPKDIVDKLNTIRSGKSFKDSQISSKLDEYVKSLSKAEKTALLAFLKGLSQIVTGEIEPEKAVDPSDNPSDVEMKKDLSGPTKRTIKPTVIKAPEKEKADKKPSSEDTSGPVPITPKK